MWSLIVFCLIVGLALGSNTPAWKDNKEYVYNVQGRSLAGLEIANEYSGILLKATLKIQTRPDGKLQCMITNPQYAQIHSELSDGWMTYIPDHEVSWKAMELSRKPFQIEMRHGVITDLIVNRAVPNWEANMIKGIMSQFQMNLNEADSHVTRSEKRKDSAFYNVYEQTVSGNTDTLYEISPMPEQMLLNSNVPKIEKLEDEDDQLIEVLKHKNYTENVELPSYACGFGHSDAEQAATNRMGTYFLRNTITRALITGNLKQFTIQHSMTINEIVVYPTLGDSQKGAVYTSWNTTLEEVKPQEKLLADLSSPVRLGGLVYAYGKPYAKTNEVKERNSAKQQIQYNKPGLQRLNPSLWSEYEASDYKQDQPQINQAPEMPFLPYTVGNKGRSIKFDVDEVQSAVQIAREIGDDVQDPRKTIEDNSFGKFITLISLLRTMDESELRQVSKELYTTSQDRPKYAAWAAFRDAVAESGHGPALLLIQSWMETKYIKSEEASYIISAMATSAQHPTSQYMKTFFELIKKPVIANDWPLNETAILSFSDLIGNVYFEKHFFRTQFPVNSFENLKDKEGYRFARETVIPYFNERLDKAIIQADTYKIHTYIRALGYIGTPEILKAFEPYLEGKKPSSKFQRTLMIASLDRLVKTDPEVAQAVLLRTYQNSGEYSETRVAAVFQLMRTSPKVEILQHMAAYTKIDTDQQVNAAVKSSIESAAKLVGEEYENLREAAIVAMNHLNGEDYGIHLGGNFLAAYLDEALDINYKQTLKVWGSDWKYLPNGVEYALTSNMRGMKNQIVDFSSMFSSIQQFSPYRLSSKYKEEKEQKQQSNESQNNPWSSENIAKILNLKLTTKAGFEGYVILNALQLPYKMLSLDNNTHQHFVKSLKKWEEKLKNGHEIDSVKFINSNQKVLGIPNEMGLPFVFSYNSPTFFKLHGKVQASSNPQVAQHSKIEIPDTVQAKINVSLTVGTKVSGHISFITPFDNQQYLSGFEKVFQAHIPVISDVQLDLQNYQVKIEVEPKEIHSGAHLVHYSTWPFIARKNILDLKTITAQKHNQIVKPQGLRRIENVFGKKENGLALKVEIEHARNHLVMSEIGSFCKYGFVRGLKTIWNDNQIQYSQFNLTYLPQESSVNKVVMRFGYQGNYKKQGSEQSVNWEEVSRADQVSSRQETLMKVAASGIKNVNTKAVDASVEFQGENNVKYILSGAYARSNVDAKSRVYAFYKKDAQQGKPFELKLEVVNNVPKPNSMDLQDVLKFEPKGHSAWEIRYTSKQGEGKIKADIKAVRSEERKQYLKERPMYQQCTRDARVGNKQSPACLNMTIEANLLDKVDMDIKYDNINSAVERIIETTYSHFQYMNYLNLAIKEESSMPKNQMKFKARFDRDLKFVNVSVNTHEQEVTFRDIELNEYVKRMLVIQPFYTPYDRVMSKVLEIDTFRANCVVDKTQVTTFNNLTYPADISKHWTVLAQYAPSAGYPQGVNQLKQQTFNYVLLVRQSQEGKAGKDLKFVMSAPETKFREIDVTMTPRQGSRPKATVMVNEKQVEIKETESYDIEDGFIQLYSLPNGEVVLVQENGIYVVYDGERAKIGSIEGYIRYSTRGLCGRFNDQQNEDFLTPQNCYARDVQKFIKSYEVEGSEGKQVRRVFEDDSEECLRQEKPVYVNVVRQQDVANPEDMENEQGNECTRFQTKYVVQGDEICFTTRVVPSCRSHCQEQGFITKNVPSYCIKDSNLAQMWKKAIDNGASPDFSHKAQNRRIQMEVPQSCAA